MIIFAFWIMMAVIVSMVAGSKGRDRLLWFAYGFAIWPIALTHILIIDKAPARR